MAIHRQPNQQDLSWFLDMHSSNKLNLDPLYQRRSVWTPKDRRFFLDTIFNNYPCPAIYLQKEITPTSYSFNVVDGKQRLQTVLDFVSNKIALAKDFPNPDIAGKKWKDIEQNDKYRNQFYNYRFTVEQLSSDVEETVWDQVFDRVNRNQKTLTDQELRHARFNGWLISYAELESEDPIWIRWKISTTSKKKRMKDVEFVSLLMLIILENGFVGFPQENLNELYAKYDFMEDELLGDDEIQNQPEYEYGDISSDKIEAFKEKLKAVKNKLSEVLDNDLLALISPKVMTYLYSLWAIFVLEDGIFAMESADINIKLKQFFTDVKNYSEDRDFAGISQEVKDFHEDASGAGTELGPRQNRHNALKSYLGG